MFTKIKRLSLFCSISYDMKKNFVGKKSFFEELLVYSIDRCFFSSFLLQ